MRTQKLTVMFFLVVLIVPGISRAQSRSNAFHWGLDQRSRYEYWDNAIGLDRNADTGQSFTRHRNRIWFDLQASPALRLYTRITNEFRFYFKPERDFTIHEIFFDNLFFQWDLPFRKPVTLTAGRQDIMFGEGFLVMDAHPLDGSRSGYFNALKLTISPAANQTLLLFASAQPRVDDWLPLLNSQDQPMTEQQETAAGIQYQINNKKSLWEIYFLAKKEDETDAWPEQIVRTLGLRRSVSFGKGWSFTGEGAWQSGRHASSRLAALGGYAYLDYRFINGKRPKTLRLGTIYLSGDDPASSTYTTWDPLFSRWPKWSFSYIMALIPETGRVAYWTNMSSVYTALLARLNRSLDLQVHAYALFAPQAGDSGNPLIGGGTRRGLLLVTRLGWTLNRHLRGHLFWDVFTPGDYYFAGADSYNYLHVELDYTL